MKIKIDQEGFLLLERGGMMKEQFCPYQQNEVHCGDWCPLLHTEISKDEDRAYMWLCAGCDFTFDVDISDFIDERV